MITSLSSSFSSLRRLPTRKAGTAIEHPAVIIRSANRLEEFQQCVDIQNAVWGCEANDIVPSRLFLLARKIGGQVVGAFTAHDKLVGFAMALPAYRDREAYLHSHMLAVLPEYRNSGLGRRIKLAQRDDAMSRGIERIEWTFDPLEIKNSYLNLHKLGAISRRYEPDFYGPSSSPLQGGLPTDRLYAEWHLRSAHVEAALLGQRPKPDLTAAARIKVPSAIAKWKQSPAHRPRAAALQSEIRTAFLAAFARGHLVVDYERDAEGNGCFLLPQPAG